MAILKQDFVHHWKIVLLMSKNVLGRYLDGIEILIAFVLLHREAFLRISRYINLSIVPIMLCGGAIPNPEKQPHTITDPSSCFTVGFVYFGSKRLPAGRLTYWILSELKILNCDSSLQHTLFQSAIEYVGERIQVGLSGFFWTARVSWPACNFPQLISFILSFRIRCTFLKSPVQPLKWNLFVLAVALTCCSFFFFFLDDLTWICLQ